MEKLRSDVIKGIRGCLISTKGNVTTNQLNKDYRTLLGERIPYSKLGFRSLEDFLQSEPTLVLRAGNGGEMFVEARASAKSHHITEMVTKQKSATRKTSAKKFRISPPSYFRRQQPAQPTRWRPSYSSARWKTNYQQSSRPAAVSHSQFVNTPYNPPRMASKVVVVPQKTDLRHRLNQSRMQSPTPPAQISPTSSQPSPTLPPQPIVIQQQVIPSQQNQQIQQQNQQQSVLPSQHNAVPNPAQTLPNPGPGRLQNYRQNLSNHVNQSQQPAGQNGFEDKCSSLQSTRKRITQKMSEVCIERDVANGSPTQEVPPQKIIQVANNEVIRRQAANPVTNPFQPTGDVVADLIKFAEMFKLGEVETSNVAVKSKQKQGRFVSCKIKVGKHIYTTYPHEFRDFLEAQKFCAKEALDDLVPKYGRRKSLLLASDKDILERIPPMLEKHPHGIWVWQLQLDYADKYNEQLPADWLKIIDSSPSIQVEKCSDNYVLRHCQPGDALQKGQKWTNKMALSDVSVPSNTVQFGDDGQLLAQVTYVMSANEIWCRQCDTEEVDEYNNTIIQMEDFYNNNASSMKVDQITVGGYYTAQFDSSWYRIRVISMEEDDQVLCFFIDYGDESLLPKSCIFRMKREFAISQAQAFVCRLVGLEELYEVSTTSENLQSILYKQVTLEMASDDLGNESLKDQSIPVYMNDFETGQSINQQMIPLLTIESASPNLQEDTVTEVHVTNIESNGDVYIQLHTTGYDSLQQLLASLEAQIVNKAPNVTLEKPTRENSVNRLYFAQYKADGHWYRIKIIDWAPQGDFAQIYFVDYGNADVVNVGTEVLYPLDKLSDVLNQYPYQAVKVKMNLEIIPQDFVQLAAKLMPDDQPVLLKITGHDHENTPLVEFFKRSSDSFLYCINKSIGMETELKKGDGNNNLKSNSKRKLLSVMDGPIKNVPSGGTLQKPVLPSIGGYLEVHIPFAVNPYNFFVQPLSSKQDLDKMMGQLQERYQEVQYSPLQAEDIVPGQIYASKHEDGNWYRTSVIKVIHSGSISVFYCDFGYYANLTVSQLIPLDVEFMELPYQSLKAKLSDIKPKQNKWTMEDCEFFKQRVEKKLFYSYLVDVEKDELYDSDIVLKLILVDTSGDSDIFIGKELADMGIAVSTLENI